MVKLQDFISECLHHHTLSSMFSDRTFEAHYAQFLSCFGLGASARFILQLVFLAFWLSSLIFSIVFRMWLGLPHPSIASILWCVCTHPIDPMGIHFLHCAHGNKHIWSHDVICDTFVAIVQDVGFHVGRKQLHSLPSTTFNLLMNWHCG
jgi:hypothetical protein